MSMDKDVIRKIKRCMELSKSSNENEAGLALKQMQMLMKKHGYTEAHAMASDVTEAAYGIGVKSRPPAWVLHLHQAIGNALECSTVIRTWRIRKMDLVFIGVGSSAEIANYAFEVLFRKLKVSRAKYIENNLKGKSRTRKTKLADAYCTGWVTSIYSKVKNLSPNEDIAKKVQAYKDTQIKNLTKGLVKGVVRHNPKNISDNKAISHGMSDASDVNLFVATESKGSNKLLGGGK